MANFTTDGKLCIERCVDASQNSMFTDLIKCFDIIETSQWIKENNFLKICLQFPDNLLCVSAIIYEEIKNRVDVDLYILGDTTYASCCVDSVAARHVQGNAIVHYGHSCFSKCDIPVFYVLPKKEIDIATTLQVITNHYDSDKDIQLCLFYDSNLEHYKDEIIPHWYYKYPQSYVAYVQIEEKESRFLGRIIRNAKGDVVSVDKLVNCVCIYIGSRGQTLFNYAVSIPAKDWYINDPTMTNIERMDETVWFKRRRFLIEKCKDANVIGILICKLAGDQTKDIIARMKQLCQENGKKSYIVSVGKPNVAKLANFPEMDIYVMIACPENNLFNSRDFYKPLVYPFELEVAFNANREQYYNNHVTDYNELLPGRKYYCDIARSTHYADVSLITGKIRKTVMDSSAGNSMDLVEKPNWMLVNIGQPLQNRTWKGLEQKLGENEATKVETGRKGLPLQYSNEPE